MYEVVDHSAVSPGMLLASVSSRNVKDRSGVYGSGSIEA